jgi:hypothetical protein
MNMRVLFTSGACLVGLAACGTDSGGPPAAATLQTDVNGIYGSNASAVYGRDTDGGIDPTAPPIMTAGTEGFGNVQLKNIGSKPLTITAVSLSGFSPAGNDIRLNAQVPPALPKALTYNSEWAVEVDCGPTQAGTLKATLTITSNDAKSPFVAPVECVFQ